MPEIIKNEVRDDDGRLVRVEEFDIEARMILVVNEFGDVLENRPMTDDEVARAEAIRDVVAVSTTATHLTEAARLLAEPLSFSTLTQLRASMAARDAAVAAELERAAQLL
jgi:hypothetical protein